MINRERVITRALQTYDKNLFCKRDSLKYVIYRKSISYDLFDFYGSKLWVTRPFNQTIMALTEDWQVQGIPCEWGIEPIMARLKAIDWMNHPELADQMIAGFEKHEESKKRDFKNTVESFLYEFRKPFAKATNDINTSTLEKLDKRRLENGTS